MERMAEIGCKKKSTSYPFSRVTEKNTKHYRSDFLYDSRKLQEAAQAAAPEERCFFWMSRPSGTWCVLEREAFIRGSSAHNIWTHYADEPEGS